MWLPAAEPSLLLVQAYKVEGIYNSYEATHGVSPLTPLDDESFREAALEAVCHEKRSCLLDSLLNNLRRTAPVQRRVLNSRDVVAYEQRRDRGLPSADGLASLWSHGE